MITPKDSEMAEKALNHYIEVRVMKKEFEHASAGSIPQTRAMYDAILDEVRTRKREIDELRNFDYIWFT
jgi:hypothetical protein